MGLSFSKMHTISSILKSNGVGFFFVARTSAAMSDSVSAWLGPPPPPTPPPPPPLPWWQDHEVSSNYCPCHYKELNSGCNHCALVWLQSARKHGIEEHIARYAWFTFSLGGTRKEVEEACTSAYDDTNGVKETSPANKIRVRMAAS